MVYLFVHVVIKLQCNSITFTLELYDYRPYMAIFDEYIWQARIWLYSIFYGVSTVIIFLIFCCLFWSYLNQEHRSISRFIGYALCAADEALKDANWSPTKQEEKERTVRIVFLVKLQEKYFYGLCLSGFWLYAVC